jgi:hypothetical protein
MKAATPAHYLFDNGISILSATCIAPLFDAVELKTTVMVTGIVYSITINTLTDCRDNPIEGPGIVRTGIPDEPLPEELVINEILFNPASNGYDFVEIFNNSQKIFNASALSLANRNNNGVIGSIKLLGTAPKYIFPGDHYVVTENKDALALNYLVQNARQVLELSSLPSFADDEGAVLLLDQQGVPVDEVKYKDDWHFKLISNPEGVSLERLDASASSDNPGNWHSASSTAGYATPTYKNSQQRPATVVEGQVDLSPKIFSPDNDGLDDYATIRYAMEEPGYVANIQIFDRAGRPIRVLARNQILGINGSMIWDGLNDKGGRLPIGPYIVYIELFNLQGQKRIYRNTVILARYLK